MRAGARNVEIFIQKPVKTGRDSLNNPVYEWRSFLESGEAIWAEVSTRRGSERFDDDSNQRYSEVTYQYTVRQFEVPGIASYMRILSDGQIYEITSILPDRSRRDYVVIDTFLQEVPVPDEDDVDD